MIFSGASNYQTLIDGNLGARKPFKLYRYGKNSSWQNSFFVPGNWYPLVVLDILTLPTPCISESCTEIKFNLNYYFPTFLRCLKEFYEGLHKTFWGTTKKCENKNSNQFSLFPESGWEGLNLVALEKITSNNVYV